MTTFADLRDRLKSFDVKKDAITVIMKKKRQYIARNVDQMKHGETKHKRVGIGLYRSETYKRMKEQLNPLARGTVDLRLTGQFHAGLFMEINDPVIMMGSQDTKAPGLEKKYESDFYGLNEDNQYSFNYDVFLPDFLNSFENGTGLKAG